MLSKIANHNELLPKMQKTLGPFFFLNFEIEVFQKQDLFFSVSLTLFQLFVGYVYESSLVKNCRPTSKLINIFDYDKHFENFDCN